MVTKKTGKAAAILTRTLGDLYQEFCDTRGESEKIRFSHFASCRPRHIRLMSQAKLRQCLCEYCTNVDLKLRVVNGVAARLNNGCRVRHVYHAVDIITCGRQGGSWQTQCAYRCCNDCTTDSLDQHVRPLRQHQGPVSWLKWESQAALVNGKRVSRKMLVRKHGTFADLIAELRTELDFLAGHLFRADWQHQQFEAMRKSTPFPPSTVGMVLDFAENFTCTFQDELQAAHWHHEQVTVHPIVTYYPCPGCLETTTESLVFISDDRVHDFNAVFHFTKVAVNHLRDLRGLEVDNIIQWTDGCASQYKSRGPFADISCALEDFSATFERNFFGSRHGKGRKTTTKGAAQKWPAAEANQSADEDVAAGEDSVNGRESETENETPPIPPPLPPEMNDWVAVGYENGWYPGIVVNQENEDESKIQFLHPTSIMGQFKTPCPSDITGSQHTFIFACPIDPPVPTPGGRSFFLPQHKALEESYSYVEFRHRMWNT